MWTFSEAHGLKDCAEVESLQDQSLTMLQHHVNNQNGIGAGLGTVASLMTQAQTRHPTRFPRLLLALGLLKTTNSANIEKIYFEKTIGSTPMEKLLCDMFKN